MIETGYFVCGSSNERNSREFRNKGINVCNWFAITIRDDAQNVINPATTYFREVIYNIEHTIHHGSLYALLFKTAFDIELEASLVWLRPPLNTAACTISFTPATTGWYLLLAGDERSERYHGNFIIQNSCRIKNILQDDRESGGSWFAADTLGNIVMLFNGGFIAHKKQGYAKSRELF